MSDPAEGIHDHPRWKTGLKDPLPESEAPRMKLANILSGAPLPPHPAVADHFSKVDRWEPGGNNDFGTCGPTSLANARRVVVSYIPLPNSLMPVLQDVYDLYRTCDGNHNFDPSNYRESDDNGVVMQQMLNNARKVGFGKNKDGSVLKPVAFAAVNVQNDDELEAAMSIFGFILCGWDLKEAQQRQTDEGSWDYVAGSRPWGGHATMEAKYSDDVQKTITWTLEVGTTDAFRRHQLSEAWVVIWPEHFQTKQFQDGILIGSLADIYKSLTGATLPIPVTPPITPPSGGTADLSFLDPVVAARIQKVAKTPENVGPWMTHHFKQYFSIP